MSMIANFRRPVKPTRHSAYPNASFGVGVLPGSTEPITHDLILVAGGSITVLEYPTATEEQPGRFTVRYQIAGGVTTRQMYATLAQANEAANEIAETTVEPAPVAPVVAPVRKSTWKPFAADDLTWAAYELNKDATDYTVVGLMPICGGSPEPQCGISGHWSMPDGEMTFSERVDLLPEPVGELSDDANGAFGTFGCESE